MRDRIHSTNLGIPEYDDFDDVNRKDSDIFDMTEVENLGKRNSLRSDREQITSQLLNEEEGNEWINEFAKDIVDCIIQNILQ